MAGTGDTLSTKDLTLRSLKTASDTNGELLQVDIVARPGGGPPGMVVFPRIEATLSVVSGAVEIRCDRTRRTLRAGDSFTFPPGSARTWRNVGDADAHLVVEFRPAGKVEQFQEALFGAMRERKLGKGWSKLVPNLLQMAVILDEYRSEIYPARPPLVVQRAVLGLLAAIGRMKGYRAGPSDHGGERVVGA